MPENTIGNLPAKNTPVSTDLIEIEDSETDPVSSKKVQIGDLPGGGGSVDSVNGQTGVVVLDADDIDDSATDHKFTTADSWLPITQDLAYTSASTHTNTNTTYSGTITADGVLPDYVCVGSKLKFSQDVQKFAIITKRDDTSGDTVLTLFLGTDYDLDDADITDVFYCLPKICPYDFPIDPDKWTVLMRSTSSRIQTPGTVNVIYNAESIAMPLGIWDFYVSARLFSYAAGYLVVSDFCLSDANNTCFDADLIAQANYTASTLASMCGQTLSREKTLTLAANATYYLNYFYNYSTGGLNQNGLRGDLRPSIVRALCAYL